MRRIVVTGIVLIGVVILSSLAATRAPETSAVVAAPSQNPQPVTVTNFPTTQGVSGTVNVGNLPLDADGNLRVSPAATSGGPQFQIVKLVEGQQFTSGTGVSYTTPYPI